MSNPTEVIALLKRARERIAVPERWTRRVMARDSQKHEVSINSEFASCWCVLGAIRSCANEMDIVSTVPAWEEMERRLPGRRSSVARFNDTHTHPEVIALLTRTIAELEAANV